MRWRSSRWQRCHLNKVFLAYPTDDKAWLWALAACSILRKQISFPCQKRRRCYLIRSWQGMRKELLPWRKTSYCRCHELECSAFCLQFQMKRTVCQRQYHRRTISLVRWWQCRSPLQHFLHRRRSPQWLLTDNGTAPPCYLRSAVAVPISRKFHIPIMSHPLFDSGSPPLSDRCFKLSGR